MRETWEMALEMCLREFRKVDIVVNNAGILIVKVSPPATRCWNSFLAEGSLLNKLMVVDY